MWAAIAALLSIISAIVAYKVSQKKTVEQKILDDINKKRTKRMGLTGDQRIIFDRDLINNTKLLLQIKKRSDAKRGRQDPDK